MYSTVNFKTKKALKLAVENGQKIGVYQPGPFNQGQVKQGTYAVEGPHYPEPHKWYAQVEVADGQIVKVK